MELESSSSAGEEATGSGGETEGASSCTTTIARTHVGYVRAHHDGDRFATTDGAHNLVLRETSSLDVLFEATWADFVDVAGGTLIYTTFDYDELSIVDAVVGEPLATVPFQLQVGVARDGSYVWTGGSAGLHVYDVDGSERWSLAGDFNGVQVLALGDTLHAWVPMIEPGEVMHFDADDGVSDSDVFTGDFVGWFGDIPRYWTQQGMVYRVYDVDNAVVALELGTPLHGWGTRLVRYGAVVDIFAADTVLAPLASEHNISGAAVFDRIDGSASIVHLDEDPVTIEPVAPTCCMDDQYADFAYADGSWVFAGDHGHAVDDLGRSVSIGEVSAIASSLSGRMAVAMPDGSLQIAERGDDCEWNEVADLPRSTRSLRMSGDGSTLLSIESWPTMSGLRSGTRVIDLPDGAVTAEYQLGSMSDYLVGHDISDDASIWSRVYVNTGYGTYSVDGFGLAGSGKEIPRVAPDAQHVVISDGGTDSWAGWVDSVTYIYDTDGFVAVLDGVNHGFIGNAHVLVSRYATSCGPYCLGLAGSDIVDMNGDVVSASVLPDVRELRPIDDNATVGVEYPDRVPAVYDVMAGTVLWSGTRGAKVEPAGLDHLLVSTGTRVELVRWR